ncbi:hypothetical protein [Nannocystis punicea]|uniref:Type IV / VI secretion system DotU domain-containing protein n=1 Tax=Nannocystis punicea TaxID=2995304 RepID=A0ABY7H611_9BACT|nr:hypothetical protein [Nannocystis poenicansa]WAS94510.1 hypothetical protein O0S08_50985 [Nannocystis poenicansa]
MPPPAVEDVRAALEELRTADRILLSVEGTTQFLRRQQGFDLLGLPTADGIFGDQTRSDNAHAGEELLTAQQAMNRAARRLGLDDDADPETLVQWGRLDDIFDHVWTDFLALGRAEHNVAVASRVRSRVRALFARVCAQHPEAAVGVAPLADEADGADDIDTRPRTDRLKLAVGIALVVAWAALLGLL